MEKLWKAPSASEAESGYRQFLSANRSGLEAGKRCPARYPATQEFIRAWTSRCEHGMRFSQLMLQAYIQKDEQLAHDAFAELKLFDAGTQHLIALHRAAMSR